MLNFPSRSWAEIDMDALAHNMREIRRITAPECEIAAVVKADAYGHGAIQVAEVLLSNGASRLAVSMVDEAIELRRSGITVPILVLGHTDARRITEVIGAELEQTVFSVEFARALSEQASAANRTIKIHIKIDTGMNRVGFLPSEPSFGEILEISRMPGIFIEGIFSHLAVADTDDDYFTGEQFRIFTEVLETLEKRGVKAHVRHICNSAGILRFPEMHLDMVRAGLIMYGMIPPGCPSPFTKVDLRPAMSLKSAVVLVKKLEPGETVSYGRRFTTERESVIATIPIGYADGYARKLSNRSSALVHGHRVPVVGIVCMDMCMLDVTDSGEPVLIGDEAVLFGKQRINGKDFYLSVDEIADLSDTINYEITCLVGKRVPRAYVSNGEIICMHSCIW
ncbi:MAG: alanine racemase [Oscillospiraceae bacterium]|nr:alanine racemase [Oscillospiraceae bacterium]